jgi:hypothetical protein
MSADLSSVRNIDDEGSRQILILLLVAGVAIIAYELGQRRQKSCPKVEYRFIPRTLEEEQALPSEALKVYKSLAGELIEVSGKPPGSPGSPRTT